MALSALRHVDSYTRNAALVAAANFLLPTPFGMEAEAPDNTLASNVLSELEKRLPRNKDEASRRSLLKELLSRELQASLMREAKISDVRDRVGQLGLLSTDQYLIEFRSQFADVCMPLGLTKAMVRAAILHPLGVEHLFPAERGVRQMDAHSLFVGRVPAREDCCVVVLTIRRGASLIVDGGWIIFYDDLNVGPSTLPTEMLKAFAQKYGCDIELGDRKEKFILTARLHLQPGEKAETVIRFDDALPLQFDHRFSFHQGPNYVQIALAFGIHVIKYGMELKKRGIQVTRDLVPGIGYNHFVSLFTQSSAARSA